MVPFVFELFNEIYRPPCHNAGSRFPLVSIQLRRRLHRVYSLYPNQVNNLSFTTFALTMSSLLCTVHQVLIEISGTCGILLHNSENQFRISENGKRETRLIEFDFFQF